MCYIWFNLQDANSAVMENMIFFHDHAMMIIMVIMIMILYVILNLICNQFNYKFMIQNQLIELIWTVIPMIILIFLAIPSLKILYLTDEINKPVLTIKAMGNQWFWSYEYSDFENIEFDSCMIKDKLSMNMFRLLDVDFRMVVPYNNRIRMLISSMDVIHSWSVPSLGIKVDSIPGRVNQILMILNRPGLFFGQCSEICGANHSFMPIVVEGNSELNFIEWLLFMFN